MITKKLSLILTLALAMPLALAAQKTLPYSYGFENNDLAAEGWTMAHYVIDTHIHADGARTGSYGFRFFYSEEPPQYLISPELQATDKELDVVFYYREQSTQYPETFQVGYSTTTASVDAFTWEDEVAATTSFQLYQTTFPAGTKYVAVKCTSNDQLYLYLDDFTFAQHSNCTKPTLSFVYSYSTARSIEMSWNGEADQYNLRYKAEGDAEYMVVEGITAKSYTITGLTPETTYNVSVQAVCSADEQSAWTNDAVFTTLESCSTPDGWWSSEVGVDEMTLEWTVADREQTEWQFAYATQEVYATSPTPDDNWTYVMVTGNPEVTVTGLQDNTTYYVAVRSHCGGDEYSGWLTDGAYLTTLERYPAPHILGASNVTAKTADVLWLPGRDEEVWNVRYREVGTTEWTTDYGHTDPMNIGQGLAVYSFYDLSPETTYEVQVQAVYGSGSDEVSRWTASTTFTTLSLVPHDLAVSRLSSSSATITWNGSSCLYDVEYASVGDAAESLLQYDNGEYRTSIGSSSSSQRTWGVMYPGEQVNGSILTKVSFFETKNYNTAPITINIYSGGDTAPGTLLYTERVQPLANNSFHEVVFASPVVIGKGENLWITLTSTSRYVMPACVSDEPNNKWLMSNGAWTSLSTQSSNLAQYGWMIRGTIMDVDFDHLTWTAESTAESMLDLDNLEQETGYMVRVRGNCAADGDPTNWAFTFFTTPHPCATPIDVEAAEVSSSTATVSWTGYQPSYNIMVTKPESFNESTMDTFEQVGDDITTDGELKPYTFDLSAYSGTGTIAIRHYNCYDMFQLNIDDITVTDAMGATVLAEDFEGGTLPESMILYDGNGDGKNWYVSNSIYCNGSYGITSASYDNNQGAIEPDNWLLIPNVPLGGTLTLYARGQDATWGEEVFGVFVSSSSELVVPASSVIVENVTDIPYTLENLQPQTTYQVAVQGINEECGTTDWSEPAEFTTITCLVLLDNDYEQPDGEKNTDLLDEYYETMVDVTLSGRTLYKDGSWNTIILPFALDRAALEKSPLAGATICEVSEESKVTGTHVDLVLIDSYPYINRYGMEVGWPFFVKWDEGDDIVDPTFRNVTIEESEDPWILYNAEGTICGIGTYSSMMMYPPEELSEGDDLIYYLSTDNKLRYTGKQRLLNAFRHAFTFTATDGSALPAGTLDFTLHFDDGTATTGIAEVDGGGTHRHISEGYYNLQGMKLGGTPRQKGVYIVNGRKVVVK